MQTQRNYRIKYGKNPPSRHSIRKWYQKFIETGSVLNNGRSGRPRTSVEDIDRVSEAFVHSPTKSIRTAARQLQLPRSTVHKVLHKNLRLYAYKVQLLQQLSQMINLNEDSLQLTLWNKFLEMKNSSIEFVLVMWPHFMFRGK